MKQVYSIRLDEAEVQRIKAIATEGNVSQWIRLLIKKELDIMSKSELINEFVERYEGTLILTKEKIDYITQEFDFEPKDKNLKIFLSGIGSTNDKGAPIYQVFLGYDYHTVVQHIGYI